MNEDDAKYLTLAIGECWHEFGSRYHPDCCVHCGNWLGRELPDRHLFNTWEEFGLVWEWSQTQKWWPKFVSQNGDYQFDEPAAGLKECGWVDTYIIDPTRFPKLITDFLREREGK